MRSSTVPKISFIIATYNSQRTIEECLSSVLMQDFPKKDYEIIIGDGGSTDMTLEIIKKFMVANKNIVLFHNPKKLSEGRGMSKDVGIRRAKGETVILLDSDNIILGRSWLREILLPFQDSRIMASQSLLGFRETNNNFLKYVNALGVEDPYAVPYSLVAQVVLRPRQFTLTKSYYIHKLDPKHILFGGANGCAFRKEVFDIIGGYTRDVDVFAEMADRRMVVAVPVRPRVHHDTSSDMLKFMKKKATYFYRFIDHEYQHKKFQWVPKDFRGKVMFMLRIFYNLSIIGPLILAIRQMLKTGRLFWILHPFFLLFITLEYGLITLFKLKNFIGMQN